MSASDRSAKPLRLRRAAIFWDCEAEWTPKGKYGAIVWEPLATHAPSDAQPHCCYASTVIFYERGTATEITRVDSLPLTCVAPTLLYLGNRWYEAGPGGVVWRVTHGQWYVRRECRANTRWARIANLGMALERKTP